MRITPGHYRIPDHYLGQRCTPQSRATIRPVETEPTVHELRQIRTLVDHQRGAGHAISNNYTQFSFAVRLPAAAAEFAKELDETITALYDTEVTKEDHSDPMVLIAQRIFHAHDGNNSGCTFQIEDLDKPKRSKHKVLYVFAEESGSPDIVGDSANDAPQVQDTLPDHIRVGGNCGQFAPGRIRRRCHGDNRQAHPRPQHQPMDRYHPGAAYAPQPGQAIPPIRASSVPFRPNRDRTDEEEKMNSGAIELPFTTEIRNLELEHGRFSTILHELWEERRSRATPYPPRSPMPGAKKERPF